MDEGKRTRQVNTMDSPVSLEWGKAELTLPGQKKSGDHSIIKVFDQGALMGVIDGLGHGDEAADASRRAIAVLERYADESVITLVRLCHNELIGTRGVVMSLASIDAREETVTWIAVGNVETLIVRSDSQAIPYQHILMRGGLIGHNLPPLHASIVQINPGDTFIFATDGIASEFITEHLSHEPPQNLADRICNKYATGKDDALVMVVRYKGIPR